MNDCLLQEVRFLRGVGEKRAADLSRLGVHTIADLFELFPRAYINRKQLDRISALVPDTRCAVVASIVDVNERKTRKGKKQLEVILSDDESRLMCIWFRYGKWLPDSLKAGDTLWVSGLVSHYGRMWQIVHPEYEILSDPEESGSFWAQRDVLPVYPLTGGLAMRQLRRIMLNAWEMFGDAVTETLPQSIIDENSFPDRKIALKNIHFPHWDTDTDRMKYRFIYEELFFHQTMLFRCREKTRKRPDGIAFNIHKTYTTRMKNQLPFSLTGAQKRVIREIVDDMTSPAPMLRLLQGDVGSGKTIVVLFAMLLAVENGYQAALMAPTEILAEQHLKSFRRFLAHEPELQIVLVLGGRYKGKKKQLERIAEGEVPIVIGTHSLVQKGLQFHKLGLAVIDEQHRFGVKQRSWLAEGEHHPDVLHLSATPIPRSLALTVFGDMSLSVIDELPPTRKPVKTVQVSRSRRPDVYAGLREQVRDGRQAYVVCPMVSESEKIDLLDAETLFGEISTELLPEFAVGLLHGRMKSDEKESVMKAFSSGAIRVLVSTVVIEVGIDVPSASVMVIEHAERFGLSQLHQLRGRIGRGTEEAFCTLIAYPPVSEEGRMRLETMVETTDGFKIAEKDLDIRGPGDFFGTEQSGLPAFRHANIVRDRVILMQARDDAEKFVAGTGFDADDDRTVQHYKDQYLEREKLFRY